VGSHVAQRKNGKVKEPGVNSEVNQEIPIQPARWLMDTLGLLASKILLRNASGSKGKASPFSNGHNRENEKKMRFLSRKKRMAAQIGKKTQKGRGGPRKKRTGLFSSASDKEMARGRH